MRGKNLFGSYVRLRTDIHFDEKTSYFAGSYSETEALHRKTTRLAHSSENFVDT